MSNFDKRSWNRITNLSKNLCNKYKIPSVSLKIYIYISGITKSDQGKKIIPANWFQKNYNLTKNHVKKIINSIK